MQWGEGAATTIYQRTFPPIFTAAILCQSLHLRWWQDCDLPCGRGGQTGKGGVGGEEDYGIEEGVSYFLSVNC